VFSQVGLPELLVVLVVVLLIFGPKRLPGLGRQLGHGMREFKDSITGDRHDDDAEDASPPAALAEPPASPEAPVVAEAPAAETPGERRS
jgi:sec-independent protein translocase protein TatA